MRSIPLNATIASVFGAASAEDTSLPCSNFFRRVCEPTGKETNHKIYKAKTENRRLRNKTAQKWDISDSPKGPKNNGQIYVHQSSKIPLFRLERSIIGFCLAQKSCKRRCIGLVTGILKRQAKCVGRDQYNRSYGPFSGTDLKTST